mmetsp:Transcript_37185/g.115735  ORF Transcript_37185/g.115735 Transcript_37185/m.115735 type:complete len:1295 (+) Transcript_37185:117-4001(+)
MVKVQEVRRALLQGDPARAEALLHKAGSRELWSLAQEDSNGSSLLHLAAGVGAAKVVELCLGLSATCAGPGQSSGKWEQYKDGAWTTLKGKQAEALGAGQGKGGLVEAGGVTFNLGLAVAQRNGCSWPIRHPSLANGGDFREVSLSEPGPGGGLAFDVSSGRPLVARVLPGSEAQEQGACVGDELLAVNGAEGPWDEALLRSLAFGPSEGSRVLRLAAPRAGTAALFPPESSNAFGQTALGLAARAGHVEVVEALLRAGAQPESPLPVRVIASTVRGTAAVEKAGTGEFELGPGLVRRGVEFDMECRKPSTVGLCFRPVDETGGRIVVASSFSQAAEACVSAGDELLMICGREAAALSPHDLRSRLRRRPIWLRFRKGRGLHRTPLQLAANVGHTAVVEKLLIKGLTQVHAKDEFGFSTLDSAVKQGHVAVIEKLLDTSGGEPVTAVFPHTDGSERAVSWPEHWKAARLGAVSAPHLEPLLDVWHLGPQLKTIVEANWMMPLFQEMWNRSFVAKFTRDRRDGGAMPRWMQVMRVELAVNAGNFRSYEQRKAAMQTTFRGREDLLPVPGGLKNDVDWQETLGLPAGQRSPLPLYGRGEEYLLHGTRPEAAHAIALSDFRLSLAGTAAGSLYGRGIYMAESIFKSDEYTTVAEGENANDGWRAVIVCRVMLGRHLYDDAKAPDAEELTRQVVSGHYDSVLGDREKVRGTFREFVIFDDDQIYPEWIVWYRRRFDEMPVDAAGSVEEALRAQRPSISFKMPVWQEFTGKPKKCAAEVENAEVAVPSVTVDLEAGEGGSRSVASGTESEGYLGEGVGAMSPALARATGGPVHVISPDGSLRTVHVDFGATSARSLCGVPYIYLVDPSRPLHEREFVQLEDLGAPLNSLPGFDANWVLLGMAEGRSKDRRIAPGEGAAQLRPLKQLMYHADANWSGCLSRAELRVLFWHLHFTSEQLAILFGRFDASKTGEIKPDDLNYILGKQLVESGGAAVDELLYGAAGQLLKKALEDEGEGLDSINFRGIEVAVGAEEGELGDQRFSKLNREDAADGYGEACRRSGYDLCLGSCTILLAIALLTVGAIAIVTVGVVVSAFLMIAGGVLIIFYWVGLGFYFNRARQALGNRQDGMDNAIGRVESAYSCNPTYHWWIVCYHYEGEVSKDSRVNREEKKKVITHRAEYSGTIPAKDVSSAFVPNTKYVASHIHCDYELDFSHSNYIEKFDRWWDSNLSDIHQDGGHWEHLDGCEDIMAFWVEGAQPWWMTPGALCASHMLFCGPCHAFFLAAKVSHQDYTYHKALQDM